MPTDGDQEDPIARNEDEHLHAFIFIDHAEKKIAELLSDLAEFRRLEFPRIRWAGSVVGDYLALLHVEVEDQDGLDTLQTFIETDLWDKGVRCPTGTEVAVINRKGTKKDTPDILALVGIKTEPGRTRAVALRLAEIDESRDRTWFKGASILTGQVDILLQLNADTLVEAQNKVFLDADLAGIEGIAWTSTAIADGSRGPWGDPFDFDEP